MHGMRYAKYDAGSATNPKIVPSGVNGIIVRTAIPVNVRSVTGADALLWMQNRRIPILIRSSRLYRNMSILQSLLLKLCTN